MNKQNEKGLNTNIRPAGVLKANKASKAHIHKVIIEECGGHDIPYVLNASTVLLYNPTLSLDSLLASIDVLRRDVVLRVRKRVSGCSKTLVVREGNKKMNEP